MKTILLTDGEIRNVLAKYKLANKLSDEYNVILIVFTKKLSKCHEKLNDNVKVFVFENNIKNDERNLVKIEKNFGMPINKVIFSDKEFHKKYQKDPQKILDYINNYYNFVHDITLNEKVDFFVTIGEDRLYNSIPYYVMKEQNKKTVFLRMIPHYGTTTTTDFFGKYTEMNNDISEISEEEVEKYIDSVINNEIHCANDLWKVKQKSIIKKLGSPLFYFSNALIDTQNPYRFVRVKNIIDQKRRMCKKIIFSHNYYTDLPNSKYVYFPFHYTEDAQVLLKSPENYNQYQLAKNIALNLPIGYNLVVNEHPFFSGGYNVKMIKELNGIPNIRVVSSKIHSRKIISNAEAIITLNSNVGYEGLLMNKPVFCLADPFYRDFHGVKKVSDITKIVNLLEISNIDRMKIEIQNNIKKDIKKLLTSGIKGGVIAGDLLSKNNIEIMKKLLEANQG